MDTVRFHRHTGTDSPKVRMRDLEDVLDYEVLFATAQISDGTASVQKFTTQTARLGDYVLHSAPYDLNRLTVTSYISGSGTTTIVASNQSGATVTINQGTWNIRILKRI